MRAMWQIAIAVILSPIIVVGGVSAFGHLREPAITGIYLNRFSGGFSGDEWFVVIPIEGEAGKYRFADIFGGGFTGQVTGKKIVLDNGVGIGAVNGPDEFTLNPRIGGQSFSFASTRAPATGDDFVPTTDKAVPGNPQLAGDWVSTTNMLDPVSGAILGGGEEALKLTVDGTALTITDPGGLYFRGVFIKPDVLEFRVIEGDGKLPSRQAAFTTLPGSATNVPQDIIGRARFIGTDAFTATVLMQSRTALGDQKQRVVTFVARRKAP